MEIRKPLLSIICLTYNHEKYIRQAITGVMFQKTNFDFELLIADDCSKDSTLSIAKEYAMKYPHIIKVLETDSNVGMYQNEKRVLSNVKSKYIMFCEGDDYWIDKNKIQTQINFLEKNDRISLVFTNRFIDDGKNMLPMFYKKKYTINDILSGQNWGIQSICYRNESFSKNEYFNLFETINGDRLIPYLCSKSGDIVCIPYFTSVYRVTGFGVATSRPKEKYIEIALEDFWNFHKILGFPNKNMLIKGQMRYLSGYFYKYVFSPHKFLRILRIYLSEYEELDFSNVMLCYYYSFIIAFEKLRNRIYTVLKYNEVKSALNNYRNLIQSI